MNFHFKVDLLSFIKECYSLPCGEDYLMEKTAGYITGVYQYHNAYITAGVTSN